ncbi:MAG TPA: orotidine-5'-phosphate decarboxylase, partial [Pyrinomonadaceae bacterium]|nr:orotidine-5'-phosphate decarboxylase [Pyrinomonadaceae bacterium]
MKSISAREKLIVALDVGTAAEARRAFAALRGEVGMFKVGSELFTSEGPGFVGELVGAGARVFLDLKFHDIPNTVAGAARAAVRLGVSLFNVHAAGGSEMMRRAAEATAEEATRLGSERPRLIAVTVLTSADAGLLAETGVAAPSVESQVARLARLTAGAGLDGVVASPRETAAIRRRCGADFAIVTPGIRGAAAGAERHDQARTMSPREAIAAGATYLVVGRPIIAAPDPVEAASAIA